MKGGGAESSDLDEFGEIARLFRPLTGGAPEALGLLDDAAVLRPPPGDELVVTTDTLVAGVHFLPDTPHDLIARKLLRVNLSDLAAKAARPWGWFLTVAWPPDSTRITREAFARGLQEDQARYGLALFGGDTVRTPGPLTVGATLVGLAPEGATVRRSGALPGDVLLVSGAIGDAGLGLRALTGEVGLREEDMARVVARHRLPQPRLGLRAPLRAFAAAAADVSDGLLADAGRIATASGCGVEVALDAVPLSAGARGWLARQPDRTAALAWLASAGDDYEVVCACRPDRADALAAAAEGAGVPLTPIGEFAEGSGVRATAQGADVTLSKLGWTHG